MLSKSEFHKAREWRRKRGLSVAELADLTGYSAVSIYHFERGTGTRKGHSIREWAWQRYKLACAAVDAQLRLGRKFEW